MSRTPAQRVRAFRLREKRESGTELTEQEAKFLDSYEAGENMSATERIVHVEERGLAKGDHVHPDAYTNMTRAEGMRADKLLTTAMKALVDSNDQYMRLAKHLLKRTTAIEDAHLGLLETVRQHFIARVQAEGDAEQARKVAELAGEDGELAQMLKFITLAQQNQAKQEKDDERKGKKTKPKDEEPLGG